MNFWRLQCFVALAEEQHFGRAANRLFISQPALSQQIKQLEDSLGVSLVIRQPRFELTEAGTALYPEALRILELVNQTIRKIAPDQSAPDGEFRLLYGRSISADQTFDLIEGFRDHAPSLEITAQTLWTSAAVEQLQQGLADAAFLRLPLENPGTIETIVLGADEQLVVISEEHPLAAKEILHIAELEGYPLIHWPRADAPGNHDEVLRQLAGQRTLLMGVPQPDQGHRVAAVARSNGFALIHASAVAGLPAHLCAKRVAPTTPLSRWGFAWDGAATHNGARVAAMLAEHLRRNLIDTANR